MATRLYFDNWTGGGIVTPSSWSAGWHKTTGGTTRSLTFSRPGTSPGSGTVSPDGTSGHYTTNLRYVSSPLATAVTIAGTVKGQALCAQQAVTNNCTLALGIKVIKPDGSDRGALLAVTASDDNAATPPEFATTATNRQFQDVSENTAIALSSVDALAGDYIVVEVGLLCQSTTTVSMGVLTGVVTGTDLPENNTSTSGDPWIEFSDNITFNGYFGSASTPTDGAAATNTADPTAVTPPSGMLAGDLVFLIGDARVAALTLAISATGGQTWTSHAAISATTKSVRVFTCTFNGTWSANPSVSFGSTTCNSAYMHVFRPPSTSYTWSVNQAQSATSDATDPFAHAGQTTTGTNQTVTMVGWHSPDDNTWGTLSGTGWEVTGTAQYRNTSGSDQSASFAHKIQTAAGATGSVQKSQLTLGADTAQIWAITMEAVPPPVSYSEAMFSAMNKEWPQTVFTKQGAVASGLTPNELINN